MRPTLIATILIIAAALVLSLVFMGQTPDTFDSHWDAAGQVNGTVSKFWGLFLLPMMMAGLTLLLVFIPRIDPLNPNFTGFKTYYHGFILLFNCFMLLVHAYTILWNAGIIRFKPNFIISLGTGLVIYGSGVMISHAKRNWFAGIRTPWTLSSDVVWDKTHQLGGKLFKVAGVLIFLSALLPKFAVWIILIASLGISLFTMVYSYIIYKQEQNTV